MDDPRHLHLVSGGAGTRSGDSHGDVGTDEYPGNVHSLRDGNHARFDVDSIADGHEPGKYCNLDTSLEHADSCAHSNGYSRASVVAGRPHGGKQP